MLVAFRSSNAGMDRDRADTGRRSSRQRGVKHDGARLQLLIGEFPVLPHVPSGSVADATLYDVDGRRHAPSVACKR